MASINQLNIDSNYYLDAFVNSRTYNEEIHYDARCQFIVLSNRKITGTRITGVTFLIRKCHCGYFLNKAYLANRTEISLAEIGDGVEAHISPDCYYTVQEYGFLGMCYSSVHKKQCFCPKPNPTAMR